MNVHVARSPEGVQQLFSLRLWEAKKRCSPYLDVTVTLELGGSDHFNTARGFATTLVLGDDRFHVRIAPKLMQADLDRQDAIIRHEIGHIIDFAVPPDVLFGWLPSITETPERRADDLASWLWGDRIFYDNDDVQTLRPGISPRPERLGL